MQPHTNTGISQIDKRLGSVIRDARMRAGFSMEDLAGRIGRSAVWVQRLESGIVSISAGTAFIIAIELGCDIVDLLQDSLGRDVSIEADCSERKSHTLDALVASSTTNELPDQSPPPQAA